MSIKSTRGVLLNWFYLLGTLHCVLWVLVLLYPPPTFLSAQPIPPPPSTPTRPKGAKNVGGFQPVCVCVGGDLAPQKLRVTSTPSHFETDPWWQLLGDPSDVSISLSKEIARGSTRSPWANQTPHKAQMDALSPACCSWGGVTQPRCSVNQSELPLQGPIP